MPESLSRRTLLGAGLAAGAAAAASTTFASPARAEESRAVELPLIGPAEGDQLHVMSFNVRLPVDDSPNSWPERRPRVAHLLEQERPTVFGIQEGFYGQGQDILEDLDGYDWIHLARQGGSNDEATAVYYDSARLKPTAYDHLWLSDTPRLIGSTTWGNEITRMLTWVRFSDLAAGGEFVFLNTHFDHQSDAARERSAEMVRDVVAEFDVPTVVVGDFNTPVGSVPYETLVNGGLEDTWVVAEERLSPEYGTFNGWNPEPVEGDPRIDWVLATPGGAALKTAINTWTDGEHTPSDHWAVHSLLTL
ncbi:MAG: endonuclease/exonuclease/phosphatase family protein [Stackebrandtia sp.]